MISSHLSNLKVFLPPLPQHDTLVGVMTLLLLVRWTGVIGLRAVSEVCLWGDILGIYSPLYRAHSCTSLSHFCLLHRDTFLAYIQRFNVTLPPLSSNTTDAAAGMHILKHVIRSNGVWVGDIIPLQHICSPAHAIPHFGKEANSCLALHTSYELLNKFWLNKYWNKEFFTHCHLVSCYMFLYLK